MANRIIQVEGSDINIILNTKADDYFSLTDIAKRFNQDAPSDLIASWMRNKDTIEFLGVWEKLYNANFNLVQLEEVKKEAGFNRFIISPTKWISITNAIGLVTKTGRYGGGTFAHKDIALAFCYWISPPFQLYIIKEFQRLKEKEAQEEKDVLEWNIKRTLSKVNYKIHSDAVKNHLIPLKIQDTKFESLYYASEADLLNVALFGMTAKEWRDANPVLKGNMRDNATTEQLLVLANLENLNAEFIKMGLKKEDRVMKLNDVAIYQMQLLINMPNMNSLKRGDDEPTILIK
jgi:KilA-N domain